MRDKRISSLIAGLIAILIMLPAPAYASVDTRVPAKDSEVWNVNLEEDETEYDIEKDGNAKTDGYTYWKITSKTVSSHPYEDWRLGPRGTGPGTVALNNSSGCNISVKNTISGSYTSIATIAASLGVTIGVSITHSCGYSVTPPSGVRWRIIYRPQYTKYKIVQKEYYKVDGHSTPTGNTKTCFVKVFLSWDYDHRVE